MMNDLPMHREAGAFIEGRDVRERKAPGGSRRSGQKLKSKMSTSEIDTITFHADVRHIESLWRPMRVGNEEMPVIDTGSNTGVPLVYVPILEQLEFVYARQIRAFSQTRRVILY